MPTKKPAAARVTFKRPYITLYFDNKDDPVTLESVASQGYCSQEVGAFKAAVPRIFLGERGKCVVMDRATKQPMYEMYRSTLPGRNGVLGLVVRYLNGTTYKEWEEPK